MVSNTEINMRFYGPKAKNVWALAKNHKPFHPLFAFLNHLIKASSMVKNSVTTSVRKSSTSSRILLTHSITCRTETRSAKPNFRPYRWENRLAYLSISICMCFKNTSFPIADVTKRFKLINIRLTNRI